MHLSRNLQTAKSVICDVYRELERRCHEASCCTFQFVVVSWKRTWTIQNTSCLPGAATVWRIGSFGPKMICATQFVQQEWKHYYRRVTFRNVIEALSRLSKSSTFGPRTRTRPSDKKGLHPPSSTCENFWSEFAAESMGKRPACSSLPAIPWRLCRRTLNAGPDVYCNRCVTTWKLQIQPDTAQVRTLHTSIPDSNKHFSTAPPIAGWSGKCISLKQLLGLGICTKGLWNGDEVKILLLKY